MKRFYKKYILPIFLAYKLRDAVVVSDYAMTKYAEKDCSREIKLCETLLFKLGEIKKKTQ